MPARVEVEGVVICALEGCGAPIPPKEHRGGWPKKFCSNAHAIEAANRRRPHHPRTVGPKRPTGGPVGWPTGRHRDPQTKAKISAKLRGRNVSVETRAKLTAAGKSQAHPPPSIETKERIAASLRARLATDPSERDRRGTALAKARRSILVKRWGPTWQRKLMQKAAAAKRGKPASPAVRANLVIQRAAKATNSPELQQLLAEHRWHPLGRRTSDELLLREHRAQAADTKRFIRKMIKTQGHRRPDDYTLAEIDGYRAAAHTNRWIAAKIGRSPRRVQQLVRLLEVDPDKAARLPRDLIAAHRSGDRRPYPAGI